MKETNRYFIVYYTSIKYSGEMAFKCGNHFLNRYKTLQTIKERMNTPKENYGITGIDEITEDDYNFWIK